MKFSLIDKLRLGRLRDAYRSGTEVLGAAEEASSYISAASELANLFNKTFNPAERKKAAEEAAFQRQLALQAGQQSPQQEGPSVLGPVLVGLGGLALAFVGWKVISGRRGSVPPTSTALVK